MRIYYPYRLEYVDKDVWLVIITPSKEYEFLVTNNTVLLEIIKKNLV